MAVQQFRLNSAFDPDYTSTGHQPLGFDQWSVFYNHYVVIGCEWSISLLGDPAAANRMVAGFYVSDDHVIPTSADLLIENGSQAGLASLYTASAFDGSVLTKDFLNKPSNASLSLDSNLLATTGANPVEGIFGSLWCQAPGGIGSGQVTYIVTLTLDVMFSEPQDLAAS